MSITKVSNNPLEGLSIKKPFKKQSKKIVNVKKIVPLSPKSFRLSLDDIDRLKDLTDIVSSETKRMKITETIIMKALIRLGGELDPNEIIQKIKIIKSET